MRKSGNKPSKRKRETEKGEEGKFQATGIEKLWATNQRNGPRLSEKW